MRLSVEETLRNLKQVEEKYKIRFIPTGEVNISEMARDCIDTIEALQQENNGWQERYYELDAGHSRLFKDFCKLQQENEQLRELAKAKAEGRLVVLKASISQDVWFYDGANRLMQGKVIEYLDCGNGLIYQVQGAKKGLWLHEHEIFLSQEEAEKVLEVRE